MSVSGISFWQQDQAWRSRSQALDQQLSFTGSLSSVLTTALANQTTGLAAIANQQALNRVNAQIAAAQGSSSSGSAASTPANGATKSASAGLHSSATNLFSSATASVLLSGQVPSGSLLSILA
jgi:hypothetical protein